MPTEMGLSFAPTGNRDQDQANGSNQTPLQDAIKVLSLRMPSFVGAAQGISPLAGMAGGGSAGVPNIGGVPGGLEDLLRRLFGGGGGLQPAGVPPLGPPPPTVSFPEIPGQPSGRPVGPGPDPSNTREPANAGVVRPGGIQASPGGGRSPMMGGRLPFQQMP